MDLTMILIALGVLGFAALISVIYNVGLNKGWWTKKSSANTITTVADLLDAAHMILLAIFIEDEEKIASIYEAVKDVLAFAQSVIKTDGYIGEYALLEESFFLIESLELELDERETGAVKAIVHLIYLFVRK